MPISAIHTSNNWGQGPASRKCRNISGGITLFLSSKQKRLEARSLTVILIFIPFKTYEKARFTE